MTKKIKYDQELKNHVIRLYLEEGRTIKSLSEEYKMWKGTIR